MSSAALYAAPITYVDATEGAAGNTALAAGGTFSGTRSGTAAGTGTDNLWRSRTGLANPAGSGTVFEAGGENTNFTATGNTEDAPRLVTTISGLTPGGSYDIKVYGWDNTDAGVNWALAASLANPAGTLTRYDGDTSPRPAAASFSTAPVLAEANRQLFEISLGTAVANASGTVLVYVDDVPSDRQNAAGSNFNQRNWYDGVGYSAVPEPAGLTVVAAGMIGVAARRRRA